MENVKMSLLVIAGMVISCVVVWLLFWVVNAATWISGLAIEAIISDALVQTVNWFWCAVIYIVGGEWLYGAALLCPLFIISIFTGGEDFGKPLGFLFAAFVILVYDPRIVAYLPGFLENAIHYIQHNCHAHLVGGLSLGENENFSGTITDPFYYTVFDIVIGAFTILWATKD